ncbi:alpha/beta hydrolase family protein [Planctobacterium marinum]|uniref:Peptidase S9 prolyl oligopeptidase catalytic domain-containing protein n=1 Tax=Planctobacterium marinum TaxID=1631968 RepID=A0AA48KRF2_9ALTE|nr:hypothetical protein MACH26_30240 [Planctobacterium marinum]
MLKQLSSLFLIAVLTACSTTSTEPVQTSSQAQKVQSNAQLLLDSGYHTDAINQVGKAIPFESYAAWLQDVKTNSPARFIKGFEQTMDAEKTDRVLKNTESYWMNYQSDGLQISGVMAWPKNWQGGKLPVVIYNRGGNFKHNVSRMKLASMLLPIAEQGFLVLASNYRGSRYSEGKDEFGGADVNDVLRLIEVAKTIPNANPDKIALFGWSRGGMMTWQTLRQNKVDIDAIVIGAGVVDQEPELKRRPEMERLMQHMIPGFKENREAELHKRSAIKWMDELNKAVPVLLLHGDKDVRVDVAQAQLAAKRLEELNHPHELVIFPGDNHGLSRNKTEVQRRVIAYLEEHLR